MSDRPYVAQVSDLKLRYHLDLQRIQGTTMRNFLLPVLVSAVFLAGPASASTEIEFEICKVDAADPFCLTSTVGATYGIKFANQCTLTGPKPCDWTVECPWFLGICANLKSKVHWKLEKVAAGAGTEFLFDATPKASGSEACYKKFKASKIRVGKRTRATKRDWSEIKKGFEDGTLNQCEWSHAITIKNENDDVIAYVDPRIILPRGNPTLLPGVVVVTSAIIVLLALVFSARFVFSGRRGSTR